MSFAKLNTNTNCKKPQAYLDEFESRKSTRLKIHANMFVFLSTASTKQVRGGFSKIEFFVNSKFYFLFRKKDQRHHQQQKVLMRQKQVNNDVMLQKVQKWYTQKLSQGFFLAHSL